MSYSSIIIDGSFAARRSWEIGDRTKEGFRFVLEGLLQLAASLRKKYTADAVIVAWDGWGMARARMQRSRVWPGYKAGRVTNDRFIADVARVQELLSAAQLWQAWADGFEADDVAATLSREVGRHLLWSADKDWLQAISPTVDMLKANTSRRPKDLAPEDRWVREDLLLTHATLATTPIRFGSIDIALSADGWHSLLTIAGDATDAVPGAKGIGPAKALRLLNACPQIVELVCRGEFEHVRRDVGSIDPKATKLVEALCAHAEELRASSELIRLRGPAEVIPTLHQVQPDAAGWGALIELLTGLGLQRVVDQLRESFEPPDAELPWSDIAGPGADDMPF